MGITPKQSAFPHPKMNDTHTGLTKREYFAIEALKGIQVSVYSSLKMYEYQLKGWQEKYGESTTVKEAMAKDAIEQADELIIQLQAGGDE